MRGALRTFPLHRRTLLPSFLPGLCQRAHHQRSFNRIKHSSTNSLPDQRHSEFLGSDSAMLVTMVNWAKRALSVLGVGAGLVGVVLALLVTFQEKLIYIPKIPGMPAFTELPDEYNLDYEDVWLESEDGTQLHAWVLNPIGWTAKQRKSHTAIIFLQENAGNMSMRLPFLSDLIKYFPCTVVALSYRGYGKSRGAPNEKGIRQDTQATLKYLLDRPDIDSSKISVLGKSLGGATGIHLAAANPGKIQSLIVENTFTSIEDVAYKVFPPLKFIIGRGKPLNILIRNKWRNFEEMHKLVDIPILLLSSINDEMLPSTQMRELYSIVKEAGAKDATWVEFPKAGHMDAYIVEQNYWPTLLHFLQKHSSDDADTEGSSDFEDIGEQPAVQAMLRAEKDPGTTAQTGHIRARYQQRK